MGVFWEPTPKQALFLSARAYEVLYGGAAGGGKTDALIVDAAGCNERSPVDDSLIHCIEHPKYRALLLRQQDVDLEQLEDRCREIYEVMCPDVRYTHRRFEFPSGAIITLSQATDLREVRKKYKGSEFQFLGWEELTEHALADAYEYMLSRVRGPAELPKRIRATTNPDGPGNDWVKERFRIPDSGAPVAPFGDTGFHRQFIPARVQDNPHIDPTYEGTLGQMSPQRQRALLLGRWDIVELEGAIYAEQYAIAMEEGRICRVPIETKTPVNTFWDIGQNDAMAIWFHQRVGLEDRFIDYFEARHQPLDFFCNRLQELGYRYDTHYLPHDAKHKRVGRHENESFEELFKEMVHAGEVEVVERVDSLRNGIEITRQVWPGCYFDETRCKLGLKALRNYRYKISPETGVAMQKPLHDWASNGADGFRQFATGWKNRRGFYALTGGDDAKTGYTRQTSEQQRRRDWRRLIHPDNEGLV